MKKFWVFLVLALAFASSAFAQDEAENTITEAGNWQYPVTYVRAIINEARVYSAPTDDAQFTPQFQIYRGSIQAVVNLENNPGWYWVIPNNSLYNPWRHWDGVDDVYLKAEDFEIFDDFDPVTVYPDSQGVDRQVVILRMEQPEMLLIEQGDIILRVPVGLGWNRSIPREQHRPEDSVTPLGEFAVAKIAVSRHMAAYPGVPLVMYYSGGMALHEAWWIDWNNTYRGQYWTGGCVNVPDVSRWNVSWEGREYSVEHWLFKWGMSNFTTAGYDPYVQELFSLDYMDPDYTTKNGTLRVLIVPEIGGLYTYSTPSQYRQISGTLTSWDGIIEQYNWLVTNRLWRLPHSENGQSRFIDVSYHEMAIREPRF